MARIKMRSLCCGPVDHRHPGQEYEVPAEEARQLVEGGYADLVEGEIPQAERRDAGAGNGKSGGKKSSKKETKSGE